MHLSVIKRKRRAHPSSARVVLACVRFAKNIIFGAATALSVAVCAAARACAYVFLLPAFRLISSARRHLERLASPTRDFTVLLFTNRYLLHVVIAVIATATVASNFSARQARAQGVGESSILYNLVADPSNRSTTEDARAASLVTDARHVGEGAISAGDIDFDYGSSGGQPEIIPMSLPGVIAPTFFESDVLEEAVPVHRTETESYVVKDGDTLAAIAQRFGVTIGTILWANGRTATQYIRPGDTLRIPPLSGVLVTVKKGDTLTALASTYGSDIAKIIEANRLNAEQSLPVGAELVLPDGEPPIPVPRVTTPKTKVNRTEAEPANVPKPPDVDVSGVSVGKLLWPTSGHVITQYYGWRHTGLDIDGDLTSPLYAAHDGVVTTAGWNSGGYGLQVVVSGGGAMTRYAHSSKLFVKIGDTVKKGQVIAMMGNTGRSTGSHLHFEVYINGVRTNPLKYIK